MSFLLPKRRHSVSCRRHVADFFQSCRRHKKMSCRLECLNNTTFDDMSGNSRHVGLLFEFKHKNSMVANSYVWADLYLSAVIDINWVCRGLFCVATTRTVAQDLATFGDVGDMSATCAYVATSSPTFRVVATQKRPRHTQFMSITPTSTSQPKRTS